MFKGLRNWLIPHRGNNYEPHLLRAWPVAVLLAVIITTFGAAQILEENLKNIDSLAAVVASVLVDLTNIDRAQEGLHGLAVNDTLKEAAQLKANHMAQEGYFSHNSPNGVTPWHWFGEAGYQFAYAGENLAVFFGDSEDVARAWMNSPSHRANILSSNFTEIGIATAEGHYQGQKTIFVVQMFGTPRVTRPIATLASEPAAPSENSGEGTVSGETIQEITEEDLEPITIEEDAALDIIHQDDMFIAVKGKNTKPAPSQTAPEMQSNLWERMLASPHTALSYVYTVIAGIVAAAIVFTVFFEMHIQRPRNIIFGVVILAVIGILLYLSYNEAIVASAEMLSGILEKVS